MKVCILTPGQPSNNPRFVKEADALVEAGHKVHAVCSDCGLWPSKMDGALMKSKHWTMEYAGGTAADCPIRYKLTRLRLSVGRRLINKLPQSTVLQRWAIARATPELSSAAMRCAADLYIAHHPSVLPSAIEAATQHGSHAGYDIEDYYSGMYPTGSIPSQIDILTEKIEAKYLPRCSYVTAASPGFADAYVKKYGIARPTPILNVFPLSDRPTKFAPTTSRGSPLRLYWFSQVLGSGRGLEDVVGALGLLNDCSFELHLRGNWIDGYRDALFSFAERASARRNRIFDYPPASPSEMVRLAAQFDIGLSTEQPIDQNKLWCISNKTFVYLLAGNAIACTAMPGQKRLLDVIHSAAFSYEPGDIRGLAEGLKHWHDDRNALDLARRQAWEWANRRYNWDVEKNAFLQAVERVENRLAKGVFEQRHNCA